MIIKKSIRQNRKKQFLENGSIYFLIKKILKKKEQIIWKNWYF